MAFVLALGLGLQVFVRQSVHERLAQRGNAVGWGARCRGRAAAALKNYEAGPQTHGNEPC